MAVVVVVVVVVAAAAAVVVVLRWYWTDLRIAKVFLHVSVVDTARQCFLIVAISHDILPSFANNNASASILAACAHHKNCLYGPTSACLVRSCRRQRSRSSAAPKQRIYHYPMPQGPNPCQIAEQCHRGTFRMLLSCWRWAGLKRWAISTCLTVNGPITAVFYHSLLSECCQCLLRDTEDALVAKLNGLNVTAQLLTTSVAVNTLEKADATPPC